MQANQSSHSQASVTVPLSKLVANLRNPRRVKPEREAHRKLVASIRAHGLLEPLVVRPENGHFRVIAGNRRLEALRAVYQDETVSIPCVVRKVEAEEAEELSLTENFTREGMHPLDEAEAFARMASVDRQGVNAIAAHFGVSEAYIRQRMKLAGLCRTVKDAYRANQIDTATAEAFAAVPEARQMEVWKETDGRPRHAQHVRNLIEDRWIDAKHALFDVDSLPAEAVSTDLFRDCVLIERKAFMQAQAAALTRERETLIEDGWKEVIVGERAEVQDRLYSMSEPEPRFTQAERARLDKLAEKREKIEIGEDDADDDKASAELDALDQEEDEIVREAQGRYDEETKCRATAFLVLSPDGRVERHYRVPRIGKDERRNGTAGGGGKPEAPPPPPTANDLSDRQAAAVRHHEAIAVRQAVRTAPAIVRKRLLVLALHDKVTSDAIALRREANGTTLHAGASETFKSDVFAALRKERDAIDPFKKDRIVYEEDAYKRLCKLNEKALDELLVVLLADCLTGHGQRETALLGMLATELKVAVRDHWTPDAEWLSGYQKIQLADLVGTLGGKARGSAALSRKKSALVEELAALFSQARTQPKGFEDKTLAERVNAWTPKRDAD
ncbi:MAG: ParB/RepB/Spo0J family partition protein [Phycisphaeraceae bacterium]|nr:ParB/RepB/Spo0J family partition protein [Phycisphaeraceae bacterium]